jgi:hypothetical protein
LVVRASLTAWPPKWGRASPNLKRFRAGQSGNPRGRQKGVRNFATAVKATLEASVSLNEKGKAKRVSTQDAALLRLKEQALKGNARALDRLLEYCQTYYGGNGSEAIDECDRSAEDQAILDAYVATANVRPPGAAATDPGRDGSDDRG